jgi:TorA maturation chaperone TorD
MFAAEPDRHLLDVLCDAQTAAQFGLLEGGGDKRSVDGGAAALAPGAANGAAPAPAAGATALWQDLHGFLRSGTDVLPQLRNEYTRLFLGPAALPVPPWESAFMAKEPVLFTKVTLKVREAYARAGFRASGYRYEADDHLATELDFMAQLAARTVAANDSGDREGVSLLLGRQQDFLREHLLAWIRGYAQSLAEADRISCVYPTLAALAALVCERDAVLIEEMQAL